MVVAELAGFIKEPSKLVRLSLLSLVAVILEQFSIDCCKTKTKVIKTVNPLTHKISLIILQTVCQMICIILVWRIWYWIN